MTKLISGLLLMGCIQIMHAQQLPLTNPTDAVNSLTNVASLSSNHLLFEYFKYDYKLILGFHHQRQWRFEGAPRNFSFSGEYIFRMPYNSKHYLIAGGHAFRYDTDPLSTNGYYAKLAYHFPLSDDPDKDGLSIACSFGGLDYQLELAHLKAVQDNDPVLESAVQHQFLPDFGWGVFFHKTIQLPFINAPTDWRAQLYLGASVPQVMEFSRQSRDSSLTYGIHPLPHFFITAGAIIHTAGESHLETSMRIKRVRHAPQHFNYFNTRFYYQNRCWMGLGLSNNKAWHLEAGIIHRSADDTRILRIGLEFDRAPGDLGRSLGSSAGIYVSLSFRKVKK